MGNRSGKVKEGSEKQRRKGGKGKGRAWPQLQLLDPPVRLELVKTAAPTSKPLRHIYKVSYRKHIARQHSWSTV